MILVFYGNLRLRRQVVPRVYQLGFKPQVMFELSVSESVIDYLHSEWELIDAGPMMADLRRKFGLTEFLLGEERLGFVEARMTRREPIAADLKTFGVNLCEVAPRGSERSWQKLQAVLSTIKVITMVAPDGLPEEGAEQLLSLYLCLEPKMNGYALAAATSLAVRRWIEAHFDEKLAGRIRRTLISLDEVLSADRSSPSLDSQSYRGYQFQVRKEPGRGFVIDIPGQACVLYVPGYEHFKEDEGWEFETHNVDTPIQQMLFLVALGMLCEEIERSRKGE